MQLSDQSRGDRNRSRGQLDEDATDFLDIFVVADDVLVAQQVAKPSFRASCSASTRV